MKHRPRTTSDNQRAQMRGCLYSVCETAKDLTPIYLCDAPSKKYAEQRVCGFHNHSAPSDKIEAYCRRYETFPEGFDT